MKVFAEPATVSRLQHLVADAAARGQRVKAIGAGRSANGLGTTDGLQIRLDRLAGIVHADRTSGVVTVHAGTRLRALNESLWRLGLALSAVGGDERQTVAGAISTGAHGSGAGIGVLATRVDALDLVLADGTLLRCSADDDAAAFAAARVGLGALGVIATVTLRCEPSFALASSQSFATADEVLDDLDDLVAGNDHVEFDWYWHPRRVLVRRHNRVLAGTELRPLGRLRRRFGERLPATPHDVIDRSYRVLTPGPSSRGHSVEYAIPRKSLVHVLAELDAWFARSGNRIGSPVEIRFAAADDIWLSTAQGRDTAYVSVRPRHAPERYSRAVESIVAEVGGRPGWDGQHPLVAEALRPLYPHFEDFRAVRDRLDPHRIFDNDYLRRVLG